MDNNTTIEDDGVTLDIFGQQVLPIYTQICFGFPITSDESYLRAIKTLETAMEKLYVQFPWLSGRVVNEGATASSSGIFKIKPRPQGEDARLFVKDLRNEPSFQSFAILRSAGFPIDALDEDLLAPRRTLMSADHSSEVFLVQATLIGKGLLLTFLGHHQAMDGIGQDHVIRLFSKACRNGDFTEEERLVGKLTSSNTLPLLDESLELPPALKYQIVEKHSPPSHPRAQISAACSWASFSFDNSSLKRLKAVAARELSPTSFISTDDALSAFIWKSVTSVRLARLSASTPSTFARAVDVRSMLGISTLHPGFVQNMTYNTLTFQELVEKPLGALASHLRSKVDPKTSTLAHDTRALATFLSYTPDKSCVSFAASIKGTSDIFFSSWAKMRCYGYDFGPNLGKAEVIRRTKSHNMTEGLMYLMPRSPEGEIGLVICLSDEDLAALRTDEEFLRFAEFVG